MRRWKRAVIGIVALVVCGLASAGCMLLGEQPASATTVGPTLPVKRGTVVTAIDTTGNVSARREAALTFEVSGRVNQVYVSEGDEVEAGQLLIALDTTDLEMEVAQARLSLAISEAQLAKLRTGSTAAEVAAAQANLESARENLAKAQEGPTQAQLAAAEAALKAAQDSYQQLLEGPDEDEIVVAKADMEKAEVALKQAQAEYDKYAWRQGFEASPQAAALHQATIDYQRALANYRLKIQDPTTAELQNALAQVERAQDDLDRLRDSPTDAEMAAAQAQVAQAELQLDQLVQGARDEDLAIAEAQVEQAQVALQQAKRRLEKAQLRSPFAGTVIAVHYDVGDFINTNIPVISLADLSGYQIEVLVDETDIAQISPGQQAEITLDSHPGVGLTGVVRSVSPEGTVTRGVVNFPVTIDVDVEELPSGPGPGGTGVLLQMTANVRIVQERRENVLLVPLEAIHREGPREYVLVSNPSGPARRVQVATGQIEGDQVEVLGELQEGEQVLLSPGAGPNRRAGGFGMFTR